MIGDIRDWFSNNKIFFEIFGIVIISLASIFIAWQANQISSYQTELTELQNQPIFGFEYEKYPWTQNTTFDKIVVYNNGGQLLSHDSDIATFLFCEIYSKDSGGIITLEIPLQGYYFGHIVSKASTGKLDTFARCPIGDPSDDYTIRNFPDYCKGKGLNAYCWVEEYIKVEYIDIFNKNHVNYYNVNMLENIKISQNEGEEIFKRYDTLLKTYLDCDDLTNETMYQAINEYIN